MKVGPSSGREQFTKRTQEAICFQGNFEQTEWLAEKIVQLFRAMIRQSNGSGEAILLRSLLEPLQKSFSKIAGEADSAGQEDYQYMATEAFASAIVSSGRLGIANMISKQLTRASSK